MEVNNHSLPVPPIPPQLLKENQSLNSNDTVMPEEESLPFIKQISGIVIANIRNIPGQIKNHIKWLVPLAFIWLLLSFDFSTIIHNVDALIFIYSIIDKLSPLVFLTAAYNNFIGKALFAGFIGGFTVPLLKESKKYKSFGIVLQSRLTKYIKVIKLAVRTFKEKGLTAFIMLLGFGGLGLAFSNLLTRNNKPDKYLVCLITAIMLINSMSKGLNDPVIRLIRSFWRDLMRIFRKGYTPSLSDLYIAIFSFSLTLAFSIVLFTFVRFTDNYVDYTGYCIGIPCVVLSIILFFTVSKKNELSK